MEVRAYSTVSEVSVVYRVDEFSIELFLRLPESYPLQPPTLREGKRVRVDQAHWRKWLLQLNIFVTNQVSVCLMDDLSSVSTLSRFVDTCTNCYAREKHWQLSQVSRLCDLTLAFWQGS